ncbi:MAG: hypothetical protein ACYDIE_06015 [Candidatus Krumholzibacteriia bacterium]
MAEVLLLVLGAALGYAAGWLQKTIDDKRRRKAVATALNAEYFRLRSTLEYLSSKWKGGKATAVQDNPPRAFSLLNSAS